MKLALITCVALLATITLLFNGCVEGYDGPTGGPRCNASLWLGEVPGLDPLATPPEMRNAVGVGITITGSCEGSGHCDGDAFDMHLLTHNVGGQRKYVLVVDSGPAQGEYEVLTTLLEAKDIIQDLLIKNGYDLECGETADYLDDLFDWLGNHWMTPSNFYAYYGL